jgi:hypothetical protein
MNTARSNCNGTRGGLRRLLRLRYALPLALLAVATAALAQKSDSPEALVRRYPFDPACPWGRVGNGKGMIVRCISEEEAEQLVKRTPLFSSPNTGAGGSPPAAADPPPNAGISGSGSESSAGTTDDLEVIVGPIVADQGELSVSKLAQPKSRYARCVLDHGGLKDKSGEVHVRFLVRSKGIAEGVSVLRRVNVSNETARCVADIVDRRRVGTPDAPLVGATVVVKFDKIAK